MKETNNAIAIVIPLTLAFLFCFVVCLFSPYTKSVSSK